jgi:FkbM family methyltransferase
MTVFESSINFYRRTLKRIAPLHSAVHWVMTRLAIPLLERSKDFKTIEDDPFWFRLELLTDRHERETTAQVARLLRPGMTVLDIGAHVGYYARLSEKLVGPQGRVIAFEPHPRTFAVLSHNVANKPAVTPLQLAVAEGEGSAELFDYLMMSASGSLHYDESLRDLQKAHVTKSDIAPRIRSDFPVQKFSVRTVALDEYLPALGVEKVDLVKMDIEGAEIGALRGMRRIITNSPSITLIMEYNPAALKAFGHEPVSAMNEVMAMGFSQMAVIEENGSLIDIGGDTNALRQLTDRLMTNMGVVNLLLTR